MALKTFTVNLSLIGICATAALFLGACSSGGDESGEQNPPTVADDSGNVSGNFQFFGIVNFILSGSQPAYAGIGASFSKFDRSVPVTGFTNELLPAEDTCVVETVDSTDDSDNDPDDFQEEIISAGEIITVSSPAGTYAELQEKNKFGSIVYQPAVEVLPVPFPTGMVLDIPGDVFPAFANVAVPNVEPLVVTDNGGVNGNYTWTTGSDSNARIRIGFTSPDSTNSDAETTVICIVIDDGQFSLPASVTSQLPSNSTTPDADLHRMAVNIIQSNKAYLLIINSSFP
jgi:hypothetical protein